MPKSSSLSLSMPLSVSLLRAREAFMRLLRPVFRRHGLTEQQWRVLHALKNATEAEVSELAKATFLLGPSLSRILRDLENLDLVSRRSDVKDQRRGLISLTSAGHLRHNLLEPELQTIYAEIDRKLGEKIALELQWSLHQLETRLAE